MNAPSFSDAGLDTRYHALDSLRAGAMLLGIALHASLSFFLEPVWGVVDVNRSATLTLFMGIVHGFRMQLYFVLGGFFAHLVCARLGPAAFARQRLKRIGIPFVVGLFTLLPLTFLFWQRMDAIPELNPVTRGHLTWRDYPTGHLWFLEYLLCFYAAALGLRSLSARLPGSAGSRADGAFAWLVCSPWKVLLLVPPVMAALAFSNLPMDPEHVGLRLLPTSRGLFYYGIFFAFGWMLHRQPGLLEEFKRRIGFHLGLAVAAFIGIMAAASVTFDGVRMHSGWAKVACDASSALYVWLMIFGLTGLCLRYCAQPSPCSRYLADASYWLYLAHLPMVLWLQGVFANLPWPALVKFALINLITIGALLLLYQYFVRYTIIGTTLNGPRTKPGPAPRPAPTPAEVPTP